MHSTIHNTTCQVIQEQVLWGKAVCRILDSAKAGEIFEDIFTAAILNPDAIDVTIDQTLATMKHQMDEIRIAALTFSEHSLLRIPTLRKGFISVFSTPAGKVYLPTAKHIWEALSQETPVFKGVLSPESSMDVFEQLEKITETYGQEIFNALRQDHSNALEKEEPHG